MSDPVAPPAAPAAGDSPAPASVVPPATPPASLDPALMYPGQEGVATPPAAAPADPAATPPPTDPADPGAKEGDGGFLSKKDGEPDPAKPGDASTPFDATKLKLEEGFEIAPATMEAFSALAKESGLSTEAAQRLLDLQTSWQKSSTQEAKDLIIAQDKTWRAELEKSPEFAGAAGVAAKATIASMVEQFGSPEIYQVFDAYGLSNHPALVRWITKMGQALSEGRPTPVGTPRVNGGVIPAANAPLPNRLYPAHYDGSGAPK